MPGSATISTALADVRQNKQQKHLRRRSANGNTCPSRTNRFVHRHPDGRGIAISTGAKHTRYERIPHVLQSRRSEEHTSELQSLMRISYAVFCLKKKKHI